MITGDLAGFATFHLAMVERQIVALLIESFIEWRKLGARSYSHNEDDITVQILSAMEDIIQERGGSIALVPVREVPEPSDKIRQGLAPSRSAKKPDITVFWGRHNSRYRIEAKKLGTKPLASEYVRNGIQRFTGGAYSIDCNRATMLGYVQSPLEHYKVLSQVNSEIVALIERDTEMMTVISPEADGIAHYYSTHQRSIQKNNIDLNHLFLRLESI